MTTLEVSLSVRTGGDLYLTFTGPAPADTPENTDVDAQDGAGRPRTSPH